MAEISAQMVKELREKTGAGMMDCKKALTESAGDFVKAEEWLRKKGISKAASKGSRVAAEGLVGLEVQGSNLGVIAEVNAETDFVAKNPEFVELTKGVVSHIVRHAPKDVDNLMEQAWTDGKKVRDLITEKVATIGENITVRRFVRFQVEGHGVVGSYLHTPPRVAALVELACQSEAATQAEAVQNLARELAMQIAAANPLYINREQVPEALIEKEKEIYKEELKASKKPEKIWDKILVGKLEKYFEQVCLVDQPWIKEDKNRDLQVAGQRRQRAPLLPLRGGRGHREEEGRPRAGSGQDAGPGLSEAGP